MKDLSATEAARRFSELLDAVEHRSESFRVIRGGRAVARIAPIGRANGKDVVAFLRANPPDPGWRGDLAAARAMLFVEDRAWND